MNRLRMALAQTNPILGNIKGNGSRILDLIDQALDQDADIAAFPELAITGYPPEDLVLRKDFTDQCKDAVDHIAEMTQDKDILIILGYVRADPQLKNSAALIHKGKIWDVYDKVRLPNYGVFDEKRYFTPGDRFPVYRFRGRTLGVNICEDIWSEDGPAKFQAQGGAEVIVNISASPYQTHKWMEREKMLGQRARTHQVHLAYLNAMGGQDELVFDGGSMVFNPQGDLTARARMFEEELLISDLDLAETLKPAQGPIEIHTAPLNQKKPIQTRIAPYPKTPEDEIWKALCLGVKDYVLKNRFSKVVVGLSGGVDSALVTAIATDALGPDRVTCIFMPSRYTSETSRIDAEQLIRNLGCGYKTIPIDAIFQNYLDELAPHFRGTEEGVAEENLQARIRGTLLMAWSNKFGHMVLVTGNKSEFSAGYSTLYGDMCGGFAPLKDVDKTMVFRLAAHRNTKGEAIPENIIRKPPTAELKPNQKDEDTLPPYPVLDRILEMYVESNKTPDEIVETGEDPSLVRRVIRMVDLAEYKRRQAPPGIKITDLAFGRDRRMPITNLFGK